MVRLAAIVASASLLFLAGIALQERRVDDNLALVARSQTDAHTERLATIVKLRGQVMQNYVADYSLWNDMGTFVTTGDPEWAEVNVNASLLTFKLSYAWVLDPAGRLVHHATTSEPSTALPGTTARAPALFGGKAFVHYFARMGDGTLVEIRGAAIQREDDAARTSEPRGYFLAARRWDDAYVAEFASLTGAVVSLTDAGMPCEAPDDHTSIVASHELQDRSGAITGRICALSGSPVAGIVSEFHRQTRSASIAFALLLLMVLTLSLHLLVHRPLSVISEALATGSSAGLAKLRSKSDEIGDLADLTHRYQCSIEERDRLRAQVYQSNKLASLSVLGTGLSHELNNPLATVLGQAEILLDAASDGAVDADEAREAASIIAGQAERMRQIIEHVRAFNPRERSAADPVALSEVLSQCRTLLDPSLSARDIRLEVVTATDGMVTCDRAKLTTIVRNLIDNAADAVASAPSGRTRRIRVEAGLDPAQSCAVLRVEDNGGGIPDDVREKIFEPFFTTKPVGRGTGLGLWIVHGVAEECGGSVSFETSPEGATFEVRLPLAPTGSLGHA